MLSKKFIAAVLVVMLTLITTIYVNINLNIQLERKKDFDLAKSFCADEYRLPEVVEVTNNNFKFRITNLPDVKVKTSVVWYRQAMPLGGPFYAHCRISLDKDLSVEILYKDKLIKDNKYYFALSFPNQQEKNRTLQQFTTKKDNYYEISNLLSYSIGSEASDVISIEKNTHIFQDYSFVKIGCNQESSILEEERVRKEGDFAERGLMFGILSAQACDEDIDNTWHIIEPSGEIYPISAKYNNSASNNSFIQTYWDGPRTYSAKIQDIKKEDGSLLITYVSQSFSTPDQPLSEKFVFREKEYIFESRY